MKLKGKCQEENQDWDWTKDLEICNEKRKENRAKIEENNLLDGKAKIDRQA
jgi:hypothetical protein